VNVKIRVKGGTKIRSTRELSIMSPRMPGGNRHSVENLAVIMYQTDS